MLRVWVESAKEAESEYPQRGTHPTGRKLFWLSSVHPGTDACETAIGRSCCDGDNAEAKNEEDAMRWHRIRQCWQRCPKWLSILQSWWNAWKLMLLRHDNLSWGITSAFKTTQANCVTSQNTSPVRGNTSHSRRQKRNTTALSSLWDDLEFEVPVNYPFEPIIYRMIRLGISVSCSLQVHFRCAKNSFPSSRLCCQWISFVLD